MTLTVCSHFPASMLTVVVLAAFMVGMIVMFTVTRR